MLNLLNPEYLTELKVPSAGKEKPWHRPHPKEGGRLVNGKGPPRREGTEPTEPRSPEEPEEAARGKELALQAIAGWCWQDSKQAEKSPSCLPGAL